MKQSGGGGLFKRKPGKLTRSVDDSSVEDMRGGGHPLRRQSSDTNLAAPAQPSHAKFMDVAKAINQQRQAEKTSKSPFSLFKKPKSRDPSPHHHRPAAQPKGKHSIVFYIDMGLLQQNI